MGSLTLLFFIFIGIGAVSLLILLVLYNRLTRSRVLVREALAGIDVQIERQKELLPALEELLRTGGVNMNLIDVLRAAADKVQLGPSVPGRAQPEDEFRTAMRSAFDSASSSADPNRFKRLEEHFVRAEQELQMAKRYYNAVVRDHNHLCESFPAGFVAALLGIRKADFYGEYQQD